MRSIELIVLLLGDQGDPVSRAILEKRHRFGHDVIAIPFDDLVADVTIGPRWQWRGITIDPAHAAVVNRLPSAQPPADETTSFFRQQQIWTLLYAELQRFAYASSIPSVTSLIGCHGSLLDQWIDLPKRVPDLPVPAFRAPWDERGLHGDVYAVDPSRLYSLGEPISPRTQRQRGRIEYVRPKGALMHVAQVGGTILFVNAPQLSPAQHGSIVAFTREMARASSARILEHAFFVDREFPVFYSTYPIPIVTGQHPAYGDLLIDGLNDDIERRCAILAA